MTWQDDQKKVATGVTDGSKQWGSSISPEIRAYQEGFNNGLRHALNTKREWVGLTYEEMKGITLASRGSIFSAIMFTYEKLNEKNK